MERDSDTPMSGQGGGGGSCRGTEGGGHPALTRVTSALGAANHFDYLLWLLLEEETNGLSMQ